MSKITLKDLSHSYLNLQSKDEDWAIRNVNIDWQDGGAYALLGPSGCGKTTLLNIISGLITPTRGKILFNDQDITSKNPVERNIAQIFQFPVIYDTMTVFENLAFPLRNRKIPDEEINKKVNEIAEMLELTPTLQNRASGLTADGKQKISLGRGLARSDVNVIMFDEPLTVIDPHLKWILRSKLKELHQRIKRTMIYVTHDQTVQTGTPVELFEKPKHTFVGHFIGSPGMNILPCKINNGSVIVDDTKIENFNSKISNQNFSKIELGIRPEFISFNDDGLPVKIINVSNTGKNNIVETESKTGKIKLITKNWD